jgi:hypothetical protein
MQNNSTKQESRNIIRTQRAFGNFQMFSSKRDVNDICNTFLNLFNQQKMYINSIYSNLNDFMTLDDVGKHYLNSLKQKFSEQITLLFSKQPILFDKISIQNRYLKDNNLSFLNLGIYQNYEDNLNDQYNLIKNKNNIVTQIREKHSTIENIIDNYNIVYLNNLINQINIIKKIKEIKENFKVETKKNWSSTNNENNMVHTKSNNYKTNFPVIGTNLKKNEFPKNEFPKNDETICVVTDIYVSNEDKLYMVIHGIVYTSQSSFYIINQRHLYEIKNQDLKELIINKINLSGIPSIFSLEKSNVRDISTINIKKLYRVHWNNFPGYYDIRLEKFTFISPVTKEGVYNNSFYKNMKHSSVRRHNINVAVCTGIITNITPHKTNRDLSNMRITYNTNGSIRKTKSNSSELDIYYHVNKWSMCMVPTQKNTKIGDSVIIINSIFQKQENSSKDVKYNTQICSSISMIGSKGVAETTEKAKLIIQTDKKTYVPNFNQNIICSFVPFTIKNIRNNVLNIDISTVEELEQKEWKIDTNHWGRQPFNVNDTINISFTKNKNGKLISQIENKGYKTY